MSEHIKVRLSHILRHQRQQMVGGQPVLVTPFIDALRKFATCPVQEFKEQYWAGRVLTQAEGWVDGVLKRRDQLLRQHGTLESARLAKEGETADDQRVGQINERLAHLAKHPAEDGYAIFGDAEALKQFTEAMEKELDVEMDLCVTRRLRLRPEVVVKGETLKTQVNGEDATYLDPLLETPEL